MKFPFNLPSVRFFLHTGVILLSFCPVFITQYAHKYDMRKLLSRGEGVSVAITVWRSAEEKYGKTTLEEGVYRLSFAKDPQLSIGDKIKAIGSVSDTLKLQNSYRIQLQVQSIRSIEKDKNSTKLRFNSIVSACDRWRREMTNRLYQTFSPQYADLLLGIVIGKDIASDSDLYKTLKDAGMLHVAVASGSNIVIIAIIFNAVIRGLLRGKMRIITTVIAVIVYSYFTGFDPSIMRALLMFSTLYAGRLFGREVSSKRSFFYTVMLLLAYEPFFIYSASFLLSASATASLLWIYPLLLKKDWFESQEKVDSVWSIVKESFFTSVSVTVFTLPLQMYLFDVVNVVSVLSNVLLSFLIIPMMILGMLHMLFLSINTSFLSFLIAPLTWALLEVFTRIINLLAILPYGVVPITSTSLIMVILYDLSLIIGMSWVASRKVL